MAEAPIPPCAAGSSRFLGIDPGNAVCGWGLVDRAGNRLRGAAWGVWKADPADDRAAALARLGDRLGELIRAARPHGIAIEQAFLGKNIQSALRLGEARGALLAAAALSGLPLREYPTAVIKKAVAGNGRADKSQVQFMMQRLLGLPSPPKPYDAADALALAFVLAGERPFTARPPRTASQPS